MNKKLFLCYEVKEEDKHEALKKTKQEPYPILKMLAVPDNKKMLSIVSDRVAKEYPLADIDYIEGKNKFTFCYIKGYANTIVSRTTLREWEHLLKEKFIRISNQHLINRDNLFDFETSKPHRITMCHFREAILKVYSLLKVSAFLKSHNVLTSNM